MQQPHIQGPLDAEAEEPAKKARLVIIYTSVDIIGGRLPGPSKETGNVFRQALWPPNERRDVGAIRQKPKGTSAKAVL